MVTFVSFKFKLSFCCMKLNLSIGSLVQKYKMYISKNKRLTMKTFSSISFSFYFKKTGVVPVGEKLLLRIQY